MRLMLAYFDYDRENNELALQQVRRVASDPSVPSEWRARHRSLQALIEREAFDDLDAAVKSACGALVLGSQTGDKFAVSSASQGVDVAEPRSAGRGRPDAGAVAAAGR
jgi:hypothetical protein